jgi:hypothetical protein
MLYVVANVFARLKGFETCNSTTLQGIHAYHSQIPEIHTVIYFILFEKEKYMSQNKLYFLQIELYI